MTKTKDYAKPNYKGAGDRVLVAALREINAEVAAKVKKGNQKYFTKYEAREAFERHHGACAYCGYTLIPRGTKANSVHFMMYIPKQMGGKAEVDNLIPVCNRCKAKHSPVKRRPIERIPNVNTVADIIDRLIVEVHKLAWFENKKREEHAKENPDVHKIAEWDNLSRDCCELRSILKRELNVAVGEFVSTLVYAPSQEARTFSPPKVVEDDNTVADIVSDMAMESAEHTLENPDEPPEKDNRNDDNKEKLTEVLKGIQQTKKYVILRK